MQSDDYEYVVNRWIIKKTIERKITHTENYIGLELLLYALKSTTRGKWDTYAIEINPWLVFQLLRLMSIDLPAEEHISIYPWRV